MADEEAFGAAWAIAERTSPFLRRQRLRPSDLPREIAAARKGLLQAEAASLAVSRRGEGRIATSSTASERMIAARNWRRPPNETLQVPILR